MPRRCSPLALSSLPFTPRPSSFSQPPPPPEPCAQAAPVTAPEGATGEAAALLDTDQMLEDIVEGGGRFLKPLKHAHSAIIKRAIEALHGKGCQLEGLPEIVTADGKPRRGWTKEPIPDDLYLLHASAEHVDKHGKAPKDLRLLVVYFAPLLRSFCGDHPSDITDFKDRTGTSYYALTPRGCEAVMSAAKLVRGPTYQVPVSRWMHSARLAVSPRPPPCRLVTWRRQRQRSSTSSASATIARDRQPRSSTRVRTCSAWASRPWRMVS